MLRFDYRICHVPGKQLFVADALPRSPVGQPSQNDLEFSRATESEYMLERVRVVEDAADQTLIRLIQES